MEQQQMIISGAICCCIFLSLVLLVVFVWDPMDFCLIDGVSQGDCEKEKPDTPNTSTANTSTPNTSTPNTSTPNTSTPNTLNTPNTSTPNTPNTSTPNTPEGPGKTESSPRSTPSNGREGPSAGPITTRHLYKTHPEGGGKRYSNKVALSWELPVSDRNSLVHAQAENACQEKCNNNTSCTGYSYYKKGSYNNKTCKLHKYKESDLDMKTSSRDVDIVTAMKVVGSEPASQTLSIQAKNTSYCLDHGGFHKDGGKVHMWKCDHGAPHANRKWKYENGTIHDGRGYCLDHGSHHKDGGKVHTWKCDPSGTPHANRKWKYENGTIHDGKGYCLDHGGNSKDGGHVHMWKCDSGTVHHNRKWSMVIGK